MTTEPRRARGRRESRINAAKMPQAATVDLSDGPIDYLDTGGDGPCLLLIHGALLNHTAWLTVIDELAIIRPDIRCVAPTFPLGGHRRPMHPTSDLSVDALALLVAELLERLDLHDVTVVMNDWGGPQLLAEHDRTERFGRMVLVACEAFDNFPPGAPGRQLVRLSRIPGGFDLLALLTRSGFGRRQVVAPMAKHRIPGDILAAWFEPFSRSRRVRDDLRRYGRSVPISGNRDHSAGLAHFNKPALVVWALEDRMMPTDHGRRLIDLMPNATLVEVEDSYTLIPLDQPRALARALADFTPQSG
jgi:pimeloyl-ACP methyl ester carboxylesterase